MKIFGSNEESFYESLTKVRSGNFEAAGDSNFELVNFTTDQCRLFFEAIHNNHSLNKTNLSIMFSSEPEIMAITQDKIEIIANFIVANQIVKNLIFKKYLITDDNGISVIGVLGQAIKENNSLSGLSFSSCMLGDDTRVLMSALRGKTNIKRLRLNDNGMNAEAIRALSMALEEETCPIERLSLDNNDLTIPQEYEEEQQDDYYHGGEITKALARNKKLKELNVSHSTIGCFSDIFLESVLRDSKIRSFDMSSVELQGYEFQQDAIEGIIEAFKKNRCLRILKLNSNNGGDILAEVISKGLIDNAIIKNLEFRDNAITSIGAGYLAEALRTNKSLVSIDISSDFMFYHFNNIGNNGLQKIIDALNDNYIITKVVIPSSLDKAMIQTLSSLIARNISILSNAVLNLRNNRTLRPIELDTLYEHLPDNSPEIKSIFPIEDRKRFVDFLNKNYLALISSKVEGYDLPPILGEFLDLEEKKRIISSFSNTAKFLEYIGQEPSIENKEIIFSMVARDNFSFLKSFTEKHCILFIKDAIANGMSLREIHENFDKITSNEITKNNIKTLMMQGKAEGSILGALITYKNMPEKNLDMVLEIINTGKSREYLAQNPAHIFRFLSSFSANRSSAMVVQDPSTAALSQASSSANDSSVTVETSSFTDRLAKRRKITESTYLPGYK